MLIDHVESKQASKQASKGSTRHYSLVISKPDSQQMSDQQQQRGLLFSHAANQACAGATYVQRVCTAVLIVSHQVDSSAGCQ
jgi:hypothetical protein